MAVDSDPLGEAMCDYQDGGLRGDCRYVDGADTEDGHIRANYFTPVEEWDSAWRDLLDSFAGPVIDVGCGTGQTATYLQDRGRDVVGLDVSPGAAAAARERGVADARVMDMFELPAEFDPGQFASLLCKGTQLGLAGSLAGISDLLADFAAITTPDATAVVDNYDPTQLDDPAEMLGYRPDPREGVARRCFHFEYDRRESGGKRLIGRTLAFLLCSPRRLRDALVGTPWTVTEIRPQEVYYRAVLEK
jgi:SAM-dependent methyltransferase